MLEIKLRIEEFDGKVGINMQFLDSKGYFCTVKEKKTLERLLEIMNTGFKPKSSSTFMQVTKIGNG